MASNQVSIGPTSGPAGAVDGPSRIMALAPQLIAAEAKVARVVIPAVVFAVLVAGWFLLPAVGMLLLPLVGAQVAIWLLGSVALGLITVGLVGIVTLPSLLLPSDDRRVAALHAWFGAREVRRLLGSARRFMAIPTTRETAEAWLATTPSTENVRPLRVEVLLLADRSDEARQEARRLPGASAIDRYRRAEAESLVDLHEERPVDERGLRELAKAIPPGVDRIEALAGLSIVLARQLVPAGDWRRPMLHARAAIPEGDVAILVRDRALPQLAVVGRRVLPAFALLIGATCALTTLPRMLG